jgi:hypothetical protein
MNMDALEEALERTREGNKVLLKRQDELLQRELDQTAQRAESKAATLAALEIYQAPYRSQSPAHNEGTGSVGEAFQKALAVKDRQLMALGLAASEKDVLADSRIALSILQAAGFAHGVTTDDPAFEKMEEKARRDLRAHPDKAFAEASDYSDLVRHLDRASASAAARSLIGSTMAARASSLAPESLELRFLRAAARRSTALEPAVPEKNRNPIAKLLRFKRR